MNNHNILQKICDKIEKKDHVYLVKIKSHKTSVRKLYYEKSSAENYMKRKFIEYIMSDDECYLKTLWLYNVNKEIIDMDVDKEKKLN